ncbi:hypothetical protein [Parvularcula sp. IMCC14364]|uniref:hypothetical protein n=1 Tax=Parvularcula sp. IMCC14364 TaxID=3067902 RepID=UPI002740EEFB|nr:hypothetical protein [Parvularcula sp. IMCC14364]
MRVVFLLLLVLTGTVACQNTGTDNSILVQSEARVINPEIVRRIEAKREAADDVSFPKLSQIPTELPDKYEQSTVHAYQDQMLANGGVLSAGIAVDTANAAQDKLGRTALWQDGIRQEMSLEEAATQLVRRLEADKAKAKALRATAPAQLGGLPPKKDR